MKQIYHSDQPIPPPLSEAKLRAERERRLLRRSLAIIAVGAILLFAGLACFFLYLVPIAPEFFTVCLFALLLAALGGCAILLACHYERRLL